MTTGQGDGGRCPACGGETRPRLRARDVNRRLSGARFTYHECRECGLLFLAAVPEDLDAFYPGDYYQVPDSLAPLEAAAPAEAYKVDLIRSFVPSGRLVEVGPAVGGFAFVAQRAGYEVSAVEMDPACSRFLERQLGVDVENTSDIPGALERSGPFDVIAMWHVIEHLRDPLGDLGAAARALEPGGVIVLATPNPDALQFRVLRERWTHLDAPRHLFLFPIAVLARAAEALGLEVALVTTADPGGLAWNRFGWRESLVNLVPERFAVTYGLMRAGDVLGAALAPVERRGRRGATYTMVLRRRAG